MLAEEHKNGTNLHKHTHKGMEIEIHTKSIYSNDQHNKIICKEYLKYFRQQKFAEFQKFVRKWYLRMCMSLGSSVVAKTGIRNSYKRNNFPLHN